MLDMLGIFSNRFIRIFSAIVAGALVVAACCCRRRHVDEHEQPGRPTEETCRCQAQANRVSFPFILTHFTFLTFYNLLLTNNNLSPLTL